MSTWKELLEYAMQERGETLADLEANTLTEADMAKEFDSGYGCIEGSPFTAWTEKTVYFPVWQSGLAAFRATRMASRPSTRARREAA